MRGNYVRLRWNCTRLGDHNADRGAPLELTTVRENRENAKAQSFREEIHFRFSSRFPSCHRAFAVLILPVARNCYSYCNTPWVLLLHPLLAQLLNPLLRIQIIKLPLRQLAVEFQCGLGIAHLLQGPGPPIEHVF